MVDIQKTKKVCEALKRLGFAEQVDLHCEANFDKVDLSGSDFKNSVLTWTDFDDANLENADFTGANLKNAILIDTNLENARIRAIVSKGRCKIKKGASHDILICD